MLAPNPLRLKLITMAVCGAFGTRPRCTPRQLSVFGDSRPLLAVRGSIHGHPLLGAGYAREDIARGAETSSGWIRGKSGKWEHYVTRVYADGTREEYVDGMRIH